MSPRPRPRLSDITGATVVRFETADGLAYNIDDAEAARRIAYTDMKLRAMPGSVSGEDVEAYLYALLRLSRERFIFDLPSSMRSNGAVSAGNREGFVHLRALGKHSPPVGRVFFLTTDRQFKDRDPESRADFERLE